MADVVDLTARRTATSHLVCPCGSEWFHLDGRAAGLDTDAGAVVVGLDGRIVGYSGVPVCCDCGQKPVDWP